MFKKIVLVIIALVIIGVGGYWIYQSKTSIKNVFDPKNAIYIIEGDQVTLIDGRAEKEIIPIATSKVEVMVWGEPAIDNLGTSAALILTYSAGGSGTFYYVVGALRDLPSGTNAILLGDRIAPQNIYINNNKIVVNYADRKLGEPMSASPSIGITRTFEINGTVLNEITLDSAKREQACMISGGTINTSLCCQSAEDFPNSCLIGACGCAPIDSHEVKVCNCGIDKCFNGNKCLGIGEPDITFCTPEQRNVDACYEIYEPVCAKVNIQCIKAPCDPVHQTFSNDCEACKNSLVESYIKGECTN